MKTISLLISAMLIMVSIWSLSTDLTQLYGLSLTSPSTNRLLYFILHASFLHVAINVYALLTLSFLCRATTWQLFAAILIASTIPSCTLSALPVVGFSTVIYAMAGMVIVAGADWRWLMFCNLLLIAAQSLFAGFAVLPHLYCFCVGCGAGFVFTPRYATE